MSENLIIVRSLLTLFYVLIWFYLVKKKSKSLWGGIEGEDKVLQISELVVLVGIIAYIFMIPADAFWGIEASEKLWYGIDIIIAVALGTSTFLKHKKIGNGQSDSK